MFFCLRLWINDMINSVGQEIVFFTPSAEYT